MLPQAISSTSAAAPNSGNRIVRPSRFSSAVNDTHQRREAFEVAIGLRLACGKNRQLGLRRFERHAVLQSTDHVPDRLLQIPRIGRGRHPEINLAVDVVVGLLRRSRRWKKSDARGHHADDGRRRVAAAHPDRLADDVRIAVELALPQLVAQDDGRRWRHAGFGVLERPAQRRLEADHAKIVARDHHALERFAALIVDQEIERPGVCRDRVERRGFLLPFLPLRGSPRPRIQDRLAVGSDGRDQHQALGLAIGRRRQEDALNQAEDRCGRADAQRQRQHRNHA